MKTTVPSWSSFRYAEVWEVLTWRDGCAMDMRTTGKFILYKDVDKLPRKYTFSSVSTKLVRPNGVYLKDIEIDLVDVSEFK